MKKILLRPAKGYHQNEFKVCYADDFPYGKKEVYLGKNLKLNKLPAKAYDTGKPIRHKATVTDIDNNTKEIRVDYDNKQLTARLLIPDNVVYSLKYKSGAVVRDKYLGCYICDTIEEYFSRGV